MNRVTSAVKTICMTPWFVKTSWGYIVTKRFRTKIEFFKGVIPAWYRFTIITYKDCRSH